MSTVVMQQPTPNPSEIQFDLHHVARHNEGDSLHPQWRTDDEYAQAIQSQSPIGTPGLMQQSPDPFMNEPYGDDQYSPAASVGLGISYPGNNAGGLSPDPRSLTASPYMGVLSDAPMTPRSDTNLGVRTRSGRSAARSDSSSMLGAQGQNKVTKSRAKKSKSNKAVNPRTPKLDAPLSELTKNMDVPVRDMVAWVNRSDEERHQEVEKRNGYITRPMNSFMLYRSAYAERTKQWCTQNNHQVVSSVSGESWPREDPTVREHYNDLARIERENHARAHPSYKFSPSKTVAASKKKKAGYTSEEDEEEVASDSGDPDWEWRPRNERSIRARSKRPGREAGYPANSNVNNMMFEQPTHGFGHMANTYSWDEQQKPLPYTMDQFDQFNNQYYPMQPQVVPVNHLGYYPGAFQENVPTGIPGVGQDDFLHQGVQLPEFNNQQVDPMLLSKTEADYESVGDTRVMMDQDFLSQEFDHSGSLFGQELDQWASSAHV